MIRRRHYLLAALIILFSLCLFGCRIDPVKKNDRNAATLILATTTSTHDSGLLDYLIPKFEDNYDVRIKTIAVGTGEAIAMGKKGQVDVLLVHSRKAEDEFMNEGYGSLRKDVMYNEFVVIGPKKDPADIKNSEPGQAFTEIAATNSSFVSRGDDSGTHKKELSIWEEIDLDPNGDWYIESGQGMGQTARIADEKQAYTLIDKATYLALKDTLDLEILIQNQEVLFNPYGVIAVSPERFSKVNNKDAILFINWLVSDEIQELIGDFGKQDHGEALFTPNADN